VPRVLGVYARVQQNTKVHRSVAAIGFGSLVHFVAKFVKLVI